MIIGWRRGQRLANYKNVLYQGFYPVGQPPAPPVALGAFYHLSLPTKVRQIIWGGRAKGSISAIARSTVKHTAGKYHAELVFTVAADLTQVGFGLDDGSESLQSPGGQANSIVWYGSGAVAYNNNRAAYTAASFATSQTLVMEADLTAGLAWFKVGAGNWNNNPSANPATGVGGFPFAFTPAYVVVVLKTQNDSATANFGIPAFGQIPSTGFIAWGIPQFVTVISDLASPVQSLFAMKRDTPMPLEAGHGVRRDAALPVESLGTALVVTKDAAVQFESLIRIQRDARLPEASASVTLAQEPMPVAVLARPLRDTPMPISPGTTAQRDSVLSAESIIAVRRDAPAPLEATHRLTSSNPLQDESTLVVRRDTPVPVESPIVVRRDAPLPAEALTKPAAAIPMPIAALRTLADDAFFNAEIFSTQLFIDSLAPLQFGHGVSKDAPLGAESLTHPRSDLLVADESGLIVRADAVTRIESMIRVVADSRVPVTMLGRIVQDAPFNMEDIAGLKLDMVVPIEILRGVRVDRALPFEAGRGVRLDMKVPTGFLALVTADGRMPLEVRLLHPLALEVATRSVAGAAHPMVLAGPAQAVVLKGPKQSMILVAPPGTFTLKGSS